MPTARQRNPLAWLLLAIALLVAWQLWPARDAVPAPGVATPAPTSPAPRALPPLAEVPPEPAAALPAFLPSEAHRVITLIQRVPPPREITLEA